jgi:hypothetical protein
MNGEPPTADGTAAGGTPRKVTGWQVVVPVATGWAVMLAASPPQLHRLAATGGAPVSGQHPPLHRDREQHHDCEGRCKEGPGPSGLSPAGRFVYVSINGEDNVVNLEVATWKVLGRVTVGERTDPDLHDSGPSVPPARQPSAGGPTRRDGLVNDTKGVRSGPKGRAWTQRPRRCRGPLEPARLGHEPLRRRCAVADLDVLRLVARIPLGDRRTGVSVSSATVQAHQASRAKCLRQMKAERSRTRTWLTDGSEWKA